jgi:prevent-host-death family protein
MEIPISQFRREMFDYINRALHGEEVVVKHRGERFRIVPERPVNRLDRITRLQIFNPDSSDADEAKLKTEIQEIWEQDVELL